MSAKQQPLWKLETIGSGILSQNAFGTKQPGFMLVMRNQKFEKKEMMLLPQDAIDLASALVKAVEATGYKLNTEAVVEIQRRGD